MTTKTKNAITVVLVLAIIMGMISFAANTVNGITGKYDEKPSGTVIDVAHPSFTLKGKTVSFLGDSITTYEGWSNNTGHNATLRDNATFYNSTWMGANDTWWKQVINELQLSLCVNNSCDAGRVTETNDLPDGVVRADELHRDNGTRPDIIIVYLGTNDLAADEEDVPFDKDTIYDGIGFIQSYDAMIDEIQRTYPYADIFVCTLLPEGRNNEEELLEYNEAIREIANDKGVTVIDLYADSGITRANYLLYVIDQGTLRVHPNEAGMDKITDCVVKALTKFYK